MKRVDFDEEGFLGVCGVILVIFYIFQEEDEDVMVIEGPVGEYMEDKG